MTQIKNEHDIGMATTYVMDTFLKKIKKHEISIENQFHKSKTQWNEETKSNLIVSIFNDYQFPPIVIASILKNNYNYSYVIDGIQRITVCLDFKNNNLKIYENSERSIVKYTKRNKNENGEVVYKLEEIDIRGKLYKDLPEELQDQFDNYNIRVDVYSPCKEEDIYFHIMRYNSKIE